MSDQKKLRESHFETFLGPIHQAIYSPRPRVDLYLFAPTPLRPLYTLITGGLSDLRPSKHHDGIVPAHIEFMLYAHEPQNWMTDHLEHLAQLVVSGRESVRHLSMIDHGRSITSSPSRLTTSLFVWPVLDNDGFSPMELDGESVELMLVIPITKGERQLALDEGTESLMKRFVNRLDPVIDEQRDCLVDDARQNP